MFWFVVPFRCTIRPSQASGRPGAAVHIPLGMAGEST
jgi:hypothetical protein